MKAANKVRSLLLLEKWPSKQQQQHTLLEPEGTSRPPNMPQKKRRIIYYLALVSVTLYILISYNSVHENVVPYTNCPEGPILTAILGGNTANNIFEYMSVFAVSRLYPEKKFAPYVPDEMIEKVEEVFERPSLPPLSVLPKKCYPSLNTLKIRLKDPPKVLQNVKSHFRNVVFDIYTSRYEEILSYGMDNIKKELRFRESDILKANEMLYNIKNMFHFDNEESPVFIGMHYRGGDYVYLLQRTYKKMNSLPTFRYYNKAMDYFKNKYRNVIFILITIDDSWLSKNLKRLSGNIVVNPFAKASKAEDLALLSQCNHTIINYGTFGTLASMMHGGTTIVYDLGVPLDHKGMTVAMGMSEILPNWIKMDERKGGVDEESATSVNKTVVIEKS